MKPSEFGGNPNPKTGVQPSPHIPTPSERLSLFYHSGDESGLSNPDDGAVFQGLHSVEVQTQKRQAEGVLEKGQEWDRLTQEAQPQISDLRPSEPQ